MYVKNWMKTDVITATKGDSFHKVAKSMKDMKIRHMPVVNKDGKVIGMISDRDVKLASPSAATSLSKGEIGYLLEKITVAEIMNHQLFIVKSNTTIEYASKIMKENKIGALPVIGDGGKIIGIISTIDVLEAFYDVMGGSAKSNRLTVQIDDAIGSLAKLTKVIADHVGFIISVVTPYYERENMKREIVIRIQTPDIEATIKDIEKSCGEVIANFECNQGGWERK